MSLPSSGQIAMSNLISNSDSPSSNVSLKNMTIYTYNAAGVSQSTPYALSHFYGLNFQPISSNLFCYLDFGRGSYGGSGTTLTDLAANISPTVVGSPSFTAGSNGYFTFNGSSSTYIETSQTVTGFASSGFTLIAIASTPAYTNRSVLWDKSAPANPPGFTSEIGTIGSPYDTNGTRFWISDNTNNLESDSNNTVTLNNQIYMFSYVWNNSTKTATTYINTTSVASTTNSSMGNFSSNTAHTLRYGMSPYGAVSYTNLYIGMVYSAPLTSTQITQNYDAFAIRFGLTPV